MKEIQAIVRELERNPHSACALATLVSVEGSSYRRAGARLLLNAAGTTIGSISGGCLESDVKERAAQVLHSGSPQVAIYDTSDENDEVWGTGLGCQGVVRVFFERLSAQPSWVQTLRHNLAARKVTHLSVVWAAANAALFGTHESDALTGELGAKSKVFQERVIPPPRLLIFGAGDDVQPLVRMAKELGWRVDVLDARPAFATPSRFPLADAVSPTPPLAAGEIPWDAWTMAVVMTHRYRDDGPWLKALLATELPYVGLLGPKKRTERILGELAGAGFAVSDAMRARLHAPVGLNLGGDSPETVALSLLAEMQAVLAGRDGRPLRERTGPIHG